MPYIYIESPPCCLSALAPCLSLKLSLFLSLSFLSLVPLSRLACRITCHAGKELLWRTLSLPIGTFQTLYPISSLYRLSFFFFSSPLTSNFFFVAAAAAAVDGRETDETTAHFTIPSSIPPPFFFPHLKATNSRTAPSSAVYIFSTLLSLSSRGRRNEVS